MSASLAYAGFYVVFLNEETEKQRVYVVTARRVSQSEAWFSLALSSQPAFQIVLPLRAHSKGLENFDLGFRRSLVCGGACCVCVVRSVISRLPAFVSFASLSTHVVCYVILL